MPMARLDRLALARAALTDRRGAVRRLSALGAGALLAGSGVAAAKKKNNNKNTKKDKRCKRDRRALKACRAAELCPQRGCCQCSATATLPALCATFPVATFADDCQDLCSGSSASFGASPTAAFANFCGTDALCVKIDCPVA